MVSHVGTNLRCSAIVLLMLAVFIHAQDSIRPPSSIQPPFEVNEVTEQVSKNRQAAPLITGEFLLDTGLVYVPEAHTKQRSSVAFDGTNYLVVWQDQRSGAGYDIYGARVTAGGVVLDPVGIVVSNAGDSQWLPDIAYGNGIFLVTWADYRNGSWDLYGARISQSGLVLDTIGIAISSGGRSQEYPSVCFDGTDFLVVWHDTRNGSYDIYGCRVSPFGVVIDTAGLVISAAQNNQWYPAVVHGDSGHLVVWQDERNGSLGDVYAARVTQSGAVLDTGGISISTGANSEVSPSLSFDGSNYLVAWADRRAYPYWRIYGSRVSQSGTVLDPAGIGISVFGSRQEYPSLTFDGTNYLVAWQDNRSGAYDIYAARVGKTGVVLEPGGVAISTAGSSQYVPSTAFDGQNFFITWQDQRGVFDNIYGARVSRSAVVMDPAGIALSTAAYSQDISTSAFDGTNYMVVWQDLRNGVSFDVYGARISQSGMIMDPTSISISTVLGSQICPAIAFDRTNYLAVWQDNRNSDYWDIYGARVSPIGAVLDPGGLPISVTANSQYDPSIGFGDTNYFVVWRDDRGGIYGARVSPSGIVFDSNGILISQRIYNGSRPSIAFDGTNYLVVWDYYRLLTPRWWVCAIYGARVSQSGAVLDTLGISVTRTDMHYRASPSVAFDGTNYLVVWLDSARIYGTRVTRSGVVIDSLGFSISSGNSSPRIAFDGINYTAVWPDRRGSPSYSDLYGARISSAGIVIDTFAVSLQPGSQNAPAIVRGQGEQLLITYSGWIDSLNGRPANTMRIWGKFLPPVGIEEKQISNSKYQKADVQIHPNPFRRRAEIELSIAQSAERTELKIYDVSGRVVKDFKLSSFVPSSVISWDGKDDSGRKLPAGVYFCRLENPADCVTRKIVKLE